MQHIQRHFSDPKRCVGGARVRRGSAYAWFGKRAPLAVGFVAFTASLSGCGMAGKAVEAGGSTARTLVGSLEPTGVVQDTTERKELMTSLRTLVDSVDAEAVNRAVTQTAAAATKLSERIDAIPIEDLRKTAVELSAAAGALRTQVDAARLDEASASVRSLADTTRDQLSTLDVEAVNAVLVDLRDATAQLGAAIEQLKNDASKTLGQVGDLSARLDEAVRATPVSELAGRVDETVNLIRTTTAKLPATTAKLDRVLGTLHFGSRVAIGVLFILGACLVVWLLRLLRPQPA